MPSAIAVAPAVDSRAKAQEAVRRAMLQAAPRGRGLAAEELTDDRPVGQNMGGEADAAVRQGVARDGGVGLCLALLDEGGEVLVGH